MAPTDKTTPPAKIYSGSISFADSTSWSISGRDKNSNKIVSYFAKTMKLNPHSTPSYNQLIVFTKSDTLSKKNLTKPQLKTQAKDNCGNAYFCEVDYATNKDILALQLMEIASIMRQYAEQNMGFLIHGALTEYNGKGVILAGRGGIGKTTASERLPETWRSLCDDTTLIVRDKSGTYTAHPWPTWSRFMFGNSGGTWDVSRNLPVDGVYFLKRDKKEKSVKINRAEAICRLVQSAEEALLPITLRNEKYDSRDMRINRFNNICTFAESTPAYTLSFSKNGNFWQEIEKTRTSKTNGTTGEN